MRSEFKVEFVTTKNIKYTYITYHFARHGPNTIILKS